MNIFKLIQHINKINVLTKFYDDWQKIVTLRVFTSFSRKNLLTKCHEDWAKNVKKTPPPGGHVFLPIRTIYELNCRIQETNVLTKFHKDWAKNKTAPSPGGHVFPLITTIFKLIRDIYITNAKNVTSRVKKTPSGSHETNFLTKFHEDWAKNVSSRLFICFHYIHIEKTAPPPGGHVFSPITGVFI
ncbi:hypothetical protein DPMN_034764 [Dreissena polymorpha]|uniref:Uncharacterized protein n=1 Tax=Dreissena polymorpha TaxID=45954 RepID=A0A9D4RKC6_DREPO|nr:hypothetical protein DPMN_034764 [Dreissena polymorpha]